MRHLLIALPICLGLSLPLAATAEPVPVGVAAAETGNGLPRGADGRCFVLTPRHLLTEASPQITTAGGDTLEVDAVRELGDDLAVLTPPEPLAGCERDWPSARGLGNLLQQAVEGQLVARDGQGEIQRHTVRLVSHSPRWVIVAAQTPNADNSGSAEAAPSSLPVEFHGALLRVHDRPVGMLIRTDADRGEGTVLRLDYLRELTAPLFSTDAATGTD
ncbi:MAG: hypothetical protein SV108_08280 [Pseudomonadota bacterium]|nr:hypothetical protein [Pseudomonadota bacterium]